MSDPAVEAEMDAEAIAFRRRFAILGVLWIVVAVVTISITVSAMLSGGNHPVLLLSLMLAMLTLAVAFGLRRCAGWSWLPATIVAALMLPLVPVGTLLGAYSIFQLVRGKLYFGD